MQLKSLISTLMISLFAFSLIAQKIPSCATEHKIACENKDEKLVKETIQMYFDGWMTGDTTKLGQAMHATCKLKNIKDGKVLVIERAEYLGFFKLRPKKKDTTGRIISLDLTGNIGSAKCEIDTPKGLATDYFNLMKVEGRWYIVDKIATWVEKG